jgi:hypothetical protein
MIRIVGFVFAALSRMQRRPSGHAPSRLPHRSFAGKA